MVVTRVVRVVVIGMGLIVVTGIVLSVVTGIATLWSQESSHWDYFRFFLYLGHKVTTGIVLILINTRTVLIVVFTGMVLMVFAGNIAHCGYWNSYSCGYLNSSHCVTGMVPIVVTGTVIL
jgi:hypothetical protein